MKYALLIYAVPGAVHGARPADDGVIDTWLDYTAATKDAGVLLGAERLAHVDTATSVTLQGTQRLLTDGPFIETKEVLGGYSILDVDSIDEAVDISKSWPGVDRGWITIELRPVMEMG